ncbi:hypothetical protein AMTRI_Chr09g19630 [Amborella trichopoda]
MPFGCYSILKDDSEIMC